MAIGVDHRDTSLAGKSRPPVDPAATVLVHDACIGPGWLDIPRWTETIFFPLALLSGGGAIVIDDAEECAEHLRTLQDTARLRGAVGLRTRIITQSLPAPNMALVSSQRDHVNEAGTVVSTTSITWSLILTPDGWRINQIHFNDARNDPSVVSEILRDSGGVE
ncbi:MAG: hypothetical protein AAGH68_09845 [Pseudomonadota bacterium]